MTPFVRDRVLPFGGFLAGFLVLLAIGVYVILPQGANRPGSGVGGPFSLTSQDGKTVTEKALTGHPTLIFFGYTHCPDICPTTLAEVTSVFKALGDDTGARDKARALFITVDPSRDTPPVLKDYLSSFDPRITGLTGTPDAIKQVAREYKAYAKAVPEKGGGYSMDHTAMTYLMNKRGEFVGAFNLDRPAKDAAAELKSYF